MFSISAPFSEHPISLVIAEAAAGSPFVVGCITETRPDHRHRAKEEVTRMTRFKILFLFPDQSQIHCWRDTRQCHFTSNWSIIKNFLRCLLLLKQQMCSWCEQSGPAPQAKVMLLLAGRWSDRNVKSPTQHLPTCQTEPRHKVDCWLPSFYFIF